MSQNLEKLFKDSLQDMDAPYNPQAWDALLSRLDAAMPVTPPKKPFNPWRASAFVIGVVGISTASYFLFNSTNEVSSKIKNSTAKTQIIKNQTNTENKPKNLVEEKLVKSSDNSVYANKFASINKDNKSVTLSNNLPKKGLETRDLEVLGMSIPERVAQRQKESSLDVSEKNLELPVISKQCLNDEVTISKSNLIDLIVTYPSGKRQSIAANKTVLLKLSETGTYKIKDSSGELENTFVVNSASEPDFEIDVENIYKSGIPSTFVKTTSIASNYKWTTNLSKTVLSGKEAEFNFFTAGIHFIQLETKDINGCENSISKTITVETNYNLMAADAFSPLSNDPRTNTFMPFALKERNSNFTLTILDPKNGGLVYTTRNAADGWDGVDKRNGNLANDGASFIWKVVLSNPIPGESESYKGIVFVNKK